jgi:CheY-like chemotaxis protein
MRLRILVLDDQVRYGRSLSRALERDYEVVVATGLEEGMERAADGFDLVLSDIRLDPLEATNRDGLRFIAWLRSRQSATPIVAMSAVDDPVIESEALAAGATRFLRKPIFIAQLRTLLAELGTRADGTRRQP